MKKTVLFVLLAVTFCTASAARAQTRTWVSGVGDDFNPCSRTSPCKTFAQAMTSTADPGEVDALDPAGYGPFTITKTMTVDGGGNGVASVLAAGVNGIIVNAPGKKVILRHLSINGAGTGINGINVIAVGELHVEDCQIFGFTNRGINFGAAGAPLFVSNTTISTNGNAAIYVANATAVIDHVVANGNQTGFLSAGSSNVTVKSSVAAGNSMGFAAAYGPTAAINLDDCISIHNDYGVVAGGGATARVNNSSIFHSNIAGLFNDGSSFLASYGNNRLNANATDGSFTSLVTLR